MRLPYRLTLVVAGMLAFASGAHAAAPPPMTVGVHPASGEVRNYFDFAARPGRGTKAGTLELRNRLGKEVTVLLDPVDGLTASTLGSAYRVRGTAIGGSTPWTRVAKKRIPLAPHGKAVVPVSVLVPEGVKPGDYLSGIGVQAVGAGRQTRPRGNVAISSIQRYAVGVLVRVPGPRHPLIRFTGARVGREGAGVTFFTSVRNPGNVVLQNVHGSQTITQGRRVVSQSRIGPGTFVSGTAIDYPVLVRNERAREGAVYRVRAILHYRDRVARLDTLVRFGHASAVRQEELGGPEASSSGDGILKYVLAAVGALALLAGLLFGWLRRRSRKRDEEAPIEPDPPVANGSIAPPDPAEEVAHRNGSDRDTVHQR